MFSFGFCTECDNLQRHPPDLSSGDGSEPRLGRKLSDTECVLTHTGLWKLFPSYEFVDPAKDSLLYVASRTCYLYVRLRANFGVCLIFETVWLSKVLPSDWLHAKLLTVWKNCCVAAFWSFCIHASKMHSVIWIRSRILYIGFVPRWDSSLFDEAPEGLMGGAVFVVNSLSLEKCTRELYV